jgi:hypothetical protein
MYLDDLPGIFIPCENLEALKDLLIAIRDAEILVDGECFKLYNVPENILDIWKDPEYFEVVDILGIKMFRGDSLEFDKTLDDLL